MDKELEQIDALVIGTSNSNYSVVVRIHPDMKKYWENAGNNEIASVVRGLRDVMSEFFTVPGEQNATK